MQHKSISRARKEIGVTAPLWNTTAGPGPVLPSLGEKLNAEVLIIGGGVAGTSTALRLAESGASVALLEAGSLGDGATGQSGGLIAPDYIRHSPDSVRDVLGEEDGERLTRMIGSSGQHVFETIEKHGIDCDARREGFYTPAHTDELAAAQRDYAAQWQSRGYAVDFIGADEVRRLFGTDHYCGALRFQEGGSLNPLAYVRGIAAAAERAGARLFADSRVLSLEHGPEGWTCRTKNGTVRAPRVVLAANAGNAALHPAMQRTTLPLHVIQFATQPLTEEQRRRVLPEGGAFTDKLPYLFTARLDGHGHLVSAFPISFLVGEAAFHREARRRIEEHFKGLPDPQVDYLWRGLAQLNVSLLPEVHELGEGAFAIQACNGRGLATNSILGFEVANFLTSGDPADLSVSLRQPAAVRLHALASLMPKFLMSMAYVSDRKRRVR